VTPIGDRPTGESGQEPLVFQRDPGLESRRRALLASLRSAVTDDSVLDAIARVPRELFLPPDMREAAYDDRALAIGFGQTISQPLIIAIMTAALKLSRTARVLEVGTGSGYQAAVLSLLAGSVVTVERLPELETSARQRLADLGYANVTVQAAGEEIGWPAEAPYDAILVAAGAPYVPRPLVGQLADGGRMVIPVGPSTHQSLTLLTKSGTEEQTSDLGGCQFVPLIGRDAWDERAY